MPSVSEPRGIPMVVRSCGTWAWTRGSKPSLPTSVSAGSPTTGTVRCGCITTPTKPLNNHRVRNCFCPPSPRRHMRRTSLQPASGSMALTTTTVATSERGIPLRHSSRRCHGISPFRHVGITTPRSWETTASSGWKNTCSARSTSGPRVPSQRSCLVQTACRSCT